MLFTVCRLRRRKETRRLFCPDECETGFKLCVFCLQKTEWREGTGTLQRAMEDEILSLVLDAVQVVRSFSSFAL
jgi:hypothetical protein